MVSFTCNCCQDVVKKPKVVGHASSCGGNQASFTCVDCMQVFDIYTIKDHTSCVSEVQKYQGQWLQKKQALKPAPPVRPPRPSMDDLSDSDDDEDWVTTKRKQVNAPKDSGSTTTVVKKRERSAESNEGGDMVTKRRSMDAQSRSSAREPEVNALSGCYEIMAFRLGEKGEFHEVMEGILEAHGKTKSMSKKKLAQEIVGCYTARIAKQIRGALDDAITHSTRVRENANGEVELVYPS